MAESPNAPNVQPANDAAIARAGRLLREGGLVAFPTETVYGLGACAFDGRAAARIFEAKGRPRFDPLIVHLARAEAAWGLAARVPEAARRLAEAYWPGPMTLVLEKAATDDAPYTVKQARQGRRSPGETVNREWPSANHPVPDLVTAGLPTVALRVPGDATARALIEAAGAPIAAPSANRFGGISPTRAEHVAAELGNVVDLILDGGPCEAGVESTVIAVSADAAERPRVLRLGGLTVEAIERVVGPVAVAGSTSRPDQGGEAAGAGPSQGSIGGAGSPGGSGDFVAPLNSESGVGRGESAPGPETIEPSPEAPGMLARHYAPGTPLRLVAAITPAVFREITDALDNAPSLGLLRFRSEPALPDPMRQRAAAIETLSPAGDGREAAANLFAALRRLDEAGLTLILAERAPDTGLGRAINDRLERAAAK